MGFKLRRFSSFVRKLVALFIVSELWKHHTVIASDALDENDSHEHNLPFYDSHNHVSEHNHFHEDGYCDCNSQGPWRPIFKPSQVDLPDPESLHHLSDNSIENSEEHLHHLTNDLHSGLHSSERQAKKQNHMIHLHLIPHIYVPLVHPVTYPVYENNDHKSSEEQTQSDFHNGATDPADSNEQLHYHHHDDHSQEHQNHFAYNQQDNHVPSPHHHYNVLHSGEHDHSQSHESEELSHNLNLYYPPHQYQVYEENRDPYYLATSSNKDSSHVLPTANQNFNFDFFAEQQKLLADRFKYRKRKIDMPMRRLRVMRPPPLGQKNTWLMGFPRSKGLPLPTSNSLFDIKPLTIKPPLFDFKPYVNSMSGHVQPQSSLTMQKLMTQAPSVVPVNKLLPAPVLVYPFDAKIKRAGVVKVKTKN